MKDRVVAVIPVGHLERAKSRLGEVLDAEERRDLVIGLLERTLAATLGTPGIAETIVVTPDDEVASLADAAGARVIRQADRGLNHGLTEARSAALDDGATALLVLPADLPAVSPAAVSDLLGVLARTTAAGRDRPRPPRARHEQPPARSAGRDRIRIRRRQPGGARARRRRGLDARWSSSTVPCRSTSTRPRTCCSCRPASWVHAMTNETGRVAIAALDGIPEVDTGHDLGALIGEALAGHLDLLPLTDADVLVVTQKVVSKAEGAVVDLTTVQPRQEAVAFAERFGRDARQVEVVMREARRIVRMDRGVLITETRHGFVCANGGIDASNVGPGSGSLVTLLPEDPDASAGRIRAAIRDRFGVDVPVIVSDSFGRPWRWGIVDVALGVSGMHPLDDLRGTPDHDGRVMQSTVRAVADEIASAAELALGKSAGRPVAMVRGAAFVRGEGSIRDLLMPAENDLFR